MSSLHTLNGRLATFKKQSWPHAKRPDYAATPETLSSAGFYLRPFPGSEDNVACFLCNKNLDGWEASDEAWPEHAKHAPHCPLVRLDTESGRLATFGNSEYWPHRALNPQKMSRAGFFYWPKLMSSKTNVDDTCICFQCGLALDGWEEGDDPRHEHAKRRPECPYIKKGVALHPCSFEFLLASKPDTNAVTHISARTNHGDKSKDPSAAKFKLPAPMMSAAAAVDTKRPAKTPLPKPFPATHEPSKYSQSQQSADASARPRQSLRSSRQSTAIAPKEEPQTVPIAPPSTIGKKRKTMATATATATVAADVGSVIDEKIIRALVLDPDELGILTVSDFIQRLIQRKVSAFEEQCEQALRKFDSAVI